MHRRGRPQLFTSRPFNSRREVAQLHLRCVVVVVSKERRHDKMAARLPRATMTFGDVTLGSRASACARAHLCPTNRQRLLCLHTHTNDRAADWKSVCVNRGPLKSVLLPFSPRSDLNLVFDWRERERDYTPLFLSVEVPVSGRSTLFQPSPLRRTGCRVLPRGCFPSNKKPRFHPRAGALPPGKLEDD